MLNLISLPEIEIAVDFVCETSIYDGVHTGRFSSGSAPVASTVITQGERTAHFLLVPNVARGTPQCP